MRAREDESIWTVLACPRFVSFSVAFCRVRLPVCASLMGSSVYWSAAGTSTGCVGSGPNCLFPRGPGNRCVGSGTKGLFPRGPGNRCGAAAADRCCHLGGCDFRDRLFDGPRCHCHARWFRWVGVQRTNTVEAKRRHWRVRRWATDWWSCQREENHPGSRPGNHSSLCRRVGRSAWWSWNQRRPLCHRFLVDLRSAV